MPITLKDLANRLGLSVTTVSRALAGYDDVSPETIQRVRKMAAETGYVPNLTARHLQKKRTDTIGFVVPTFGPRFSDPFFSEFLAGIGNEAASLNYDLLLFTRAPGEEEEKAYTLITQSRRVDGLILVRTRQNDWRIQFLHEQNFPFVAFGRSNMDFSFPFVDVDGRAGIRSVVNHLAELSHQRIAMITPPANLYFTQERYEGFREGLADHGIPLDPQLVIEGNLTQRSGYEAASNLLALVERPTAIVCCNDLSAFGAITAAQDLNLEVGRDVAITGFDGIPQSENSHPPLTTLFQPVYDIGRRVTRMLIDLLDHKPIAETQVLLDPKLILRASTLGRR
jgi:LacI family transcriptional regulator